MDRTLLLLRALTLVAGVLLVFGLFARVALLRSAPARVSRAAWLLVTGVECATLVNYAVAELLAVARLWLDHAAIREIARRFYSGGYLVNGILDAALPAVLLVLTSRGRPGRRASLLLVVAIAAVSIGGVARGAPRDWDALMTVAQVIALLGIGGYLTFCALFILKRLVGVDPYLAGYVAVAAVFSLVLPIQEAIFQAVGQVLAVDIWHLNQSLQLVRSGVQFAIVLACIKKVRREEWALIA